MALVTIVGFPCSGKSTRAAQLARAFQERLDDPSYVGPKLEVVVVSDESAHVPRTIYDDSVKEKSGRGALFTNLTRNLHPSKITICDSLNYIKGFRYQMYVAAREAKVRIATVHIAVPPDVCREWHDQRGECSYTPSTWVDVGSFDNLLMRFEEPSSMVRWDSPLFTIPYTEEPPYDDIWLAITKGEKKPPTAAVATASKPPPNTLQILTTTTSLITTSLLSHLSSSSSPPTFPIPSPPGPAASFPPLLLHLPPRHISLPELQRLKRQFEGVQTRAQASGSRAASSSWGEAEVAGAFVRFLETHWETNGD